MAKNGYDLQSIKQECHDINKSMATIGVAGSAATVPGVGLLFQIDASEVDIGLGVHGEAGMYRSKVGVLEYVDILGDTKVLHPMLLKNYY